MIARRATLLLGALCAIVVSCGALASQPITLAEWEHFVRPIDFAVDETHAYMAYARFPSADLASQIDAEPDVRLGIYSRTTGAEVAKLDLLGLWEDPPDVGPAPFVKVTNFREGVVVSVLDVMNGAAFLAYIDRNGNVGPRQRVEGTFVVGLMRHRNFVVAAIPERVALFDEHLNLRYEWSPSGTVVLAQATATDIVLLDGVLDRATGLYEGTVRWLSLGDALEERAETPVPVAVAIHPPPKLLVGPTGLALVVHDGSDNWRECRLPRGDGEFECQQPAWGRDLKALHGMFQSALVNVVRSADGYVVTVPYGCAIWSRRYDQEHSIAPRQLAVPTGSWEQGMIQNLVVHEWDGALYALTTAFVTRGGDGGEYPTVLREFALSESLPIQAAEEIPGCPSWSDVEFMREVTAENVRACARKGADPNAVFNCGTWTRPLGMAARQGNAEAVTALIAAGAKVNVQDEEGDTALHDAARHGRSERTIQALLDSGADAMLRNASGKTAWDYAQDNEALRGSDVMRRRLRPE